jgi:uncharacterized membrane protein (UPF0136 family)
MAAEMKTQTILWIYIVLLVAGGVMGLLKGKSKISLIVSVGFAIPLILCNLNVIPFRYHIGLLIALLLLFAWRLYKSEKFMPSGLMLILTILALALPFLLS